MEQARALDEVVDRLDDIIADAARRGSRSGYFAAMYRAVTLEVRRGIRAGEFGDGARMDHFDTVFANLYLDAYRQRQAGDAPVRCWRTAFEAADCEGMVVIQHLLLGMNAHINHDLGLAAARVAPGAELPTLRADFERMNDLLASMVDEMQDAVSSTSLGLRVLDVVGLGADESIVNFSMRNARREAWEVAELLAAVPPAVHPQIMRYIDRRAGQLADLIRNPAGSTGEAVGVLRRLQREDVREVIDRLRRIGDDRLSAD